MGCVFGTVPLCALNISFQNGIYFLISSAGTIAIKNYLPTRRHKQKLKSNMFTCQIFTAFIVSQWICFISVSTAEQGCELLQIKYTQLDFNQVFFFVEQHWLCWAEYCLILLRLRGQSSWLSGLRLKRSHVLCWEVLNRQRCHHETITWGGHNETKKGGRREWWKKLERMISSL